MKVDLKKLLRTDAKTVAVLDACRSPRTAEEIITKLKIDKFVVYRRLVQAVANGRAEKAPDPRDGRRSIYTLTDAGKSFLNNLN